MSEKQEEKEVKEEGTFKMKKKKKPSMKKLNSKDNVTKIDLTKKESDAVQESSPDEKVLQSNAESNETEQENKVGLQEVVETHTEKPTATEESKEEVITPVIQEITDIGEKQTETPPVAVLDTPRIELPENVEKLVEFMKDTGGTVEDYIRLNADYTNVNDDVLLKEYYKKTKPHLDTEEIEFVLDDKFTYDADYDDEKDIRKKKLAIKEEVAKAKSFLEEMKIKYYDEIKLRPGTTQEQQKAMDFFNRYNEEQEASKQRHDEFKSTTKNYFSDDFKGFEINVGEKKFRYGVKNPNEVADAQSDISTFIKKFLSEDGSVKDYKGYHKAIYAARNVDTIAQHFYEQGQADAIKNVSAKSKNISNEARQSPSGDIYINGLRVKAISGVDSSKLKIQKRKL
jgi:hypothetical protein